MTIFSRAALLVLVLSQTAFAQSLDNYVIGPQDVLSITVFDTPDLGNKYTVELDGSFSFPLIGRVKAGGMTLRDFEALLAEKLAKGYLKNPQITVGIDQYRSQRVFVTGEVRNPGAYALTGDMSLIEALAKAGSTLNTASDEVVVVRGGRGNDHPLSPETGGARDITRVNLKDLQSGRMAVRDVDLRDGDTIYVARAEQVYVFGQVRNPASYAVQTTTTVLQALSMAGGVMPNGAMNRTKVIRLVNGENKELSVKLTDVVLPGDTIVVPVRFF